MTLVKAFPNSTYIAKVLSPTPEYFQKIDLKITLTDDEAAHQKQVTDALLNIIEMAALFNPSLCSQRHRVLTSQIYCLLKAS